MKLFARKHTMLAVFTGIVLLSLFLAACGGSSNNTSSKPVNGKGCTKIGVLLPESDTSARWEADDHPDLVSAIKAALPGATVDVTNAQGSSTTQQTQAEADLTNGDCILVLAPHDSVAAAAIVEKAHSQNVPVISYDRLIQDKNIAAYVSFDGEQVGKLQGQYIVDHHKAGDNVSLINGSQTDNNAILFNKGVEETLQPLFASGELHKVYDVFTPDWNNATAQTEMDAALTTTHNNIQIAYVANDGMANTVIAALKQVHLNGKVLVTGQDATVAGIQNILTGDQSMTVYKAITKEANATAQVVAALSNGTSVSAVANGATIATSDGGTIPAVLETPVAVDISNIASTVLADNFVTKAQICAGLPAGTGNIC